jgi:RND family efflux transporter MFP subunit
MTRAFPLAPLLAVAVACRAEPPIQAPAGTSAPATARLVVRDTVIRSVFEAAGSAAPVQEATLSTKLAGAVTAVLVQEGDAVRAGQLLLRIDARDLDARRSQALAALAEAEAGRADAERTAQRFRALYADSAAARIQLDAAETALARAEAAVRGARAAGAEVAATAAYAEVRAPFAGTISRRHVDPGAFAAPGTPLLELRDASRLRLTASAPPSAVRGLRRGDTLAARIEDEPVSAVVEAVLPAAVGNLAIVNALVPNRGLIHPSGSAAALDLPHADRRAVLVPLRAVTRDGDLTAVRLAGGDAAPQLRWVRLGTTVGDEVEVLSGLQAGDTVVTAIPPGRQP